MSSSRDPRGHLKFSLRITGWFLLIFAVAVVGLYFATRWVVHDALEEEWELTHSEVSGTIDAEGEVGGVEVREVAMRATPPPEVREAVDRQIREDFPVLIVPIILLGLLGGLGITYRAARQVRRVTRTVQDILESAGIDEFHDIIERIFVQSPLSNSHQVVMVQPLHYRDLAHETLLHSLVA